MNRDMQVYGCDMAKFVDSVTSCVSYKLSGANMIIAGLMSDAQEQMAFDDVEGARKTLNRAKYLLFKVMEGELIGTSSNLYPVAEVV